MQTSRGGLLGHWRRPIADEIARLQSVAATLRVSRSLALRVLCVLVSEAVTESVGKHDYKTRK